MKLLFIVASVAAFAPQMPMQRTTQLYSEKVDKILEDIKTLTLLEVRFLCLVSIWCRRQI